METEKKKVLFCATVDRHIQAFHLPYLRWFQERGWEVHVAANGSIELPYTNRRFVLPIERSPFKRGNLRAYKQLRSIMEDNNYGIVHCHTPLGGVLARLAARRRRAAGTRVLYTAHGFHFYKGAPLLCWLLYYPVERLLSIATDCLVTINEEDYARVRRHRFRAQRIEHIRGVGVDTKRFRPLAESARQQERDRLGYGQEPFLLFYAAEFNRNKNQQLLLHALALLKDTVPHARLLLAGDGPLRESCRQLAESLGVAAMVDFLGSRSDVDALLPLCDVAVASSLREGLPVNLMEAMSCGLPIVATANRGHSELVADGVNGYVVASRDSRQFAARLFELSLSPGKRRMLGAEGRKRIGPYALSQVEAELTAVYRSYLAENAENAGNVEEPEEREERKDEAEGQYRSAYL